MTFRCMENYYLLYSIDGKRVVRGQCAKTESTGVFPTYCPRERFRGWNLQVGAIKSLLPRSIDVFRLWCAYCRIMTHQFTADQALNWLVLYFDARSMFVRRSGTSSATTACNYGVPQGSSLGLLCFNLYIASLSSVIGSFGVRHHQYADDTQMYIAASKDDLKVNIDILEKCTTTVHQ